MDCRAAEVAKGGESNSAFVEDVLCVDAAARLCSHWGWDVGRGAGGEGRGSQSFVFFLTQVYQGHLRVLLAHRAFSFFVEDNGTFIVVLTAPWIHLWMSFHICVDA